MHRQILSGLCLLSLTVACANPAQPSTDKRRPQHVGFVTRIRVTPGGVYTCSQAGVLLDSAAERSLLLEPGFRCLDFDLDGERLLAVGGVPGQSGALAVRSAGGHVETRIAGEDLLYAVAVAMNGVVVAGGADGQVRVFDAALRPQRIWFRHTAPCRALAFCGDTLCSAGRDGLLVLGPLDGDGGQRVLRDHTAGIECIAIDRDSGLCASGAVDGKVRLHRLAPVAGERALQRTWQRLGSAVHAVALLPPVGAVIRVACGLADGRVLILRSDSDQPDVVFAGAEPVQALCARGTSGGIKLWVGSIGAVTVCELASKR